jgi:tetratricopeptide (TPR) repeat protein
MSLTNEGIMYGMIYDFDNTPVSAVTVYINDKKVADSDIQGRFILEKVIKKDEYRIMLTKRGYEPLEEVFTYDPMQVLYFKMINSSQLLALAETALDSAEFGRAESYLNRALLIEPSRSDILFLKSIVFYLQNQHDEASTILEGLIRSGSTDPSVSRLLEMIRRAQEPEE